MKLLRELVAALLVLSSLAVSYARSEETAPAPAPACISSQMFLDRIKPQVPWLELSGQKLIEFNARYKLKYNDEPPDGDRVFFFSDSDDGPVAYVVVFKDDCIIAMGQADRQKIMELENGIGL